MNCWILYAGSVNECKQQNDKIMHNNSFHFVQEGNDDLNNRRKSYSTKIASLLYTKLIYRWLRDGFFGSNVGISLLSVVYPTNWGLRIAWNSWTDNVRTTPIWINTTYHTFKNNSLAYKAQLWLRYNSYPEHLPLLCSRPFSGSCEVSVRHEYSVK